MTAVLFAARELHATFEEFWEDCKLPDFPTDGGSDDALRAMFELDLALNPLRLAWDYPRRKRPTTHAWSLRTVTGFRWLRDLLDGLIERSGSESLSTELNFERWADSRASLPELITIEADRIHSLSRAIERITGELDVESRQDYRLPPPRSSRFT